MAFQHLPAIAMPDHYIARIAGDEPVQIMCIERVELPLNRPHLWHYRIVATAREPTTNQPSLGANSSNSTTGVCSARRHGCGQH